MKNFIDGGGNDNPEEMIRLGKERRQREFLEGLAKRLGTPAEPVIAEIRRVRGADAILENEGNTVYLWDREDKKRLYPTGEVTLLVDSQGRLTRRLDNRHRRAEEVTYDDSGYVARESVVTINNNPSGIERRYTYGQTDDGRKFLKAIDYRVFETPKETRRAANFVATQDESLAMQREVERGERLQKSFLYKNPLEELVSVAGSEIHVEFDDDGKPKELVSVDGMGVIF